MIKNVKLRYISNLQTINSGPYTFQFSSHLSEMSPEWDQIDSNQSLMASNYLNALCDGKPVNIDPAFILVIKDHKPIGKILIQISQFDATKRLHLDEVPLKTNLLDYTVWKCKKLIAGLIKLDVLVIGNLCSTGPFGFRFINDVSSKEQSEILRLFIEAFCQMKPEINLVLLKEFPHSLRIDTDVANKANYFHEFEVQPGMIFYINPAWANLQDYLNDLQSKYRLRIRKALELGEGLSHRELGFNEIQLLLDDINILYLDLAEKADFNLVELNKKYFLNLKAHMGDKFKLYGFFFQGKLLSFYTTIHNDDELIAHFLGVNKQFNEKYSIYFNILVHLIDHSILGRYKKLNLARTALEIKSSVGAKAEPLYFYLRHTKSWVHWLLPLILRWLRPSTDWIERSPFKRDLKLDFIPINR